ncbi:hypothetical protein ACHAXR_012062 [Thalassiosira sp. AJA248-18]
MKFISLADKHLDIKEGAGIPFSDNKAEEFHDDENCNKDKWDEGGRSDCGYSESVHDTLMVIGEATYSLFGEPSDMLKIHMKGVGSCFQEASYAARDLTRGTGTGTFAMDENLDVITALYKSTGLPIFYYKIRPTNIKMGFKS